MGLVSKEINHRSIPPTFLIALLLLGLLLALLLPFLRKARAAIGGGTRRAR